MLSFVILSLYEKVETDPTPAWKKQKKKAKENSTSFEKKKPEWEEEESPNCLKKTETMLITTNRNR